MKLGRPLYKYFRKKVRPGQERTLKKHNLKQEQGNSSELLMTLLASFSFRQPEAWESVKCSFQLSTLKIWEHMGCRALSTWLISIAIQSGLQMGDNALAISSDFPRPEQNVCREGSRLLSCSWLEYAWTSKFLLMRELTLAVYKSIASSILNKEEKEIPRTQSLYSHHEARNLHF